MTFKIEDLQSSIKAQYKEILTANNHNVNKDYRLKSTLSVNIMFLRESCKRFPPPHEK